MASGLYSQHLERPAIRHMRNGFLAILLLSLGLVVLLPLIYMFCWSFGPNTEMASSAYSIFPKVWSWESYKGFFEFSEYSVRWIWNSLIVATSVVVLNVVFASLAGYAFSKINFKGNKFLFFLILLGMMIPYQVTQVPLYILFVTKFHLTNTYLALILPGCCTAYNIFLAKQFFSGIPTALIENAKVEGASQLRIFWSIILPLSKTVLAVMAITTFMGNWNTFFWPFLITSDASMYTIQVGLKTFAYANGTLFSPMMAGAMVSALPMFILFFSLQKYFLEGVTIGAVKG